MAHRHSSLLPRLKCSVLTAPLFAGLFSIIFSSWTLAEPVADSFRYPLDDGWTPSRGFASSFVTSWCGYHLANDIPRPAGTVIKAVANGTVKYSGTVKGLGYPILIEHLLPDGSKVISVYFHTKRPADGGVSLSAGQNVTKGQTVGYVSDRKEDYGTGPHLHFGIRKGVYITGKDPRTEKWFYPGYSAIYENGVKQCSGSDPVHFEIVNDWEDPVAFIKANSGNDTSCTIDQSVPDPRLDIYSSYGSNQVLQFQPIGQEFIPTRDEHNEITLLIGNINPSSIIAPITVTIRPISIFGPSVATSTVTPNLAPYERGLITFNLSNEPGRFLNPGQTYVIDVATTTPRWGLTNSYDNPSPYPNGRRILFGAPIDDNSAGGGSDLVFRTCVINNN